MKNSWKTFLDNETKKPYFTDLLEKIRLEENNKKVVPEKQNIFRAFNYFEIEETKVILLGQDPYHTNNFADGLAFSSQTNKCPKSLNNILKELKKDYPEVLIETFSLENWAKQGILLLNTCLTVNENQAFSHHNYGWEIFIDNLLQYVIQKNNNIIFVLWGKAALKVFENLPKELSHNIKGKIVTSHPSPLSYARGKSPFKNYSFFKKLNNMLDKPIDFSLRKEN
ncbi:uracil-DNA glycosylase [Mycoplasmopsis opalescens]|uniref:uracil-DNA glycosylase n=1 Tax=Mycoplasmopsis opalescens TaxID=114886 RepID=UPI0004A6ADD3|nr:uracil-DNA glycosylase [Mycoplasmopsis opalescens]